MEAKFNIFLKKKKRCVLMKVLHKVVNNDFCEYAKELWYKSVVKGENILLTRNSRVCSLDKKICLGCARGTKKKRRLCG